MLSSYKQYTHTHTPIQAPTLPQAAQKKSYVLKPHAPMSGLSHPNCTSWKDAVSASRHCLKTDRLRVEAMFRLGFGAGILLAVLCTLSTCCKGLGIGFMFRARVKRGYTAKTPCKHLALGNRTCLRLEPCCRCWSSSLRHAPLWAIAG